jgi:hypothetical protein
MREYLWAIIAGVCILALIVVGAVFIPRIFSSTHIEEPVEIVMPGHWYQTTLNDQQLKTLQTLWGSDMTTTQFIKEIWPEVLLRLPKEGVDAFGKQGMGWIQSWEDYEQVQILHQWSGVLCAGGTAHFEIYLGRRAEEGATFRRSKEPPIVEDRCYRISIYTDDVLDAPEYSG